MTAEAMRPEGDSDHSEMLVNRACAGPSGQSSLLSKDFSPSEACFLTETPKDKLTSPCNAMQLDTIQHFVF